MVPYLVEDREKSKDQLIEELEDTRRRVFSLEAEARKKEGDGARGEDSSALFDIYFRKTTDVIVTVDHEYRVVNISPSVEAFLEYRPEEIIGRPLLELKLLAPGHLEKAAYDIKRVLGGQVIHSATYKFIAKDGSSRLAEMSSAPIYHNGEVVRSASVIRDITERKRFEEAVRESREFSSSLLAYSPNPIIVINPDTSIRYVNPALEKITGYSFIELLDTRSPYPWWPEEKHAAAQPEADDRYAHLSFRREEEFRNKKGEGFWVEISTAPVRIDNQLRYYISNWVDITERKRAEQALRESEEKLRLVFESMGEGMIIGDLQGTILLPNEAAVRIAGYERKEEVIGRNIFEFLPVAIHERAFEDMRMVLETGRSGILEYKLLRKDGSKVDIEGNATVVMDAEGNRTGTITLIRDVTEKKRARRKLQESEQRWRTLLNNSPDNILSVDRGGTIQFINRPVLGLSAEEMVGTSIFHYIGPGQRETYRNRLEQAFRTGEVISLEVEGRDNSWFMTRFVPIVTERDEVVFVMIIATDITERERMAKVLIRKTEELERTNRELEQFAYVASHDLQEPVRMVASYLQLIVRRYRGRLDDEGEEFIGFATQGAIRLQAMVKDLLVYSRVGTKGMRFASTDTDEIVDQALSDLETEIRESGAILTRDPLPEIVVDRSQCILLFRHLIGNAIKFRNEGTPQIHISAKRGGREWIFSVKDNGIGIEPQYVERIFQVFQRLHGGTYPGTGIGLAVCKRIIERHEGEIWVESEIGKGATFYFTIPVKEGEVS